ncbi:MgtC/SapB family protein [Phyllobacterium myrsinacearum]|uniref:MgtC/SapB family protein n=1 Tax=Phyllobacterium myrsinacearum TaxID=28101 RepID=UPI0032B2C6BA
MLTDYEMVLRLLLAAVLGSLVGFERERLLWAAGLRTHMLVAVGACLAMLVSAFGFADVLGSPHVVLDPSRIAAQVITGVGFLGAGTILLRGEVVRGLTTAASLWGVASIGLAVGGGLYLAGFAATVIILLILAGIKPLEERFRSRTQTHKILISAKRGSISVDVIGDVAGAQKSLIKQFIVQPSGTEDVDDVEIMFVRLSPQALNRIVGRIKSLPTVSHVETDVNT